MDDQEQYLYIGDTVMTLDGRLGRIVNIEVWKFEDKVMTFYTIRLKDGSLESMFGDSIRLVYEE